MPAPASGAEAASGAAAAAARQSAPEARGGAASLAGMNSWGGGAAYMGGTTPVSSHSSHCAAVASGAAGAASSVIVAVAVAVGAGAGAVAAPGRRGSISYDLAGYAPACLVSRYCSYSDNVDCSSSRMGPVRGKAGRFAPRDGGGVRRTCDAGARTAASSMRSTVLGRSSQQTPEIRDGSCNRARKRAPRREGGPKIQKNKLSSARTFVTRPALPGSLHCARSIRLETSGD